MNMKNVKIFSKIFNNPKYASYHFPKEDAFLYHTKKDKILVMVTDGITRDPLGVKIHYVLGEIKKISEIAKHYPRPSPAKIAAELFCNKFISFLKNQIPSEKIITSAMMYANIAIRSLNRGLTVDYLENDFWACVGVGAMISKNTLYYGFVADCGICIFNKNGKLLFRTPNEVPTKKIDVVLKNKYHTSFRYPKGRRIVRGKWRNHKNQNFSYGAFTGEREVKFFIKTGKQKISKDSFIILYTDGMEPILFSNSLKRNFSSFIKNTNSYIQKNSRSISGREGTLVIVEYT